MGARLCETWLACIPCSEECKSSCGIRGISSSRGGGAVTLTHERNITISTGQSRKDMNWRAQVLTIGDLYDRLKTPARGTESQRDFFNLPKNKRDELKDCGGFMAGTLSGPRRKANAVTGRDVVTLDLDAIKPYDTDTVLNTIDGLGCSYCVYSTRSHHQTGPRLRVLIPLDRTVSADEYEPIARRLAEQIGIHQADPTTFEPSRLMYWPSCCMDGEYVYRFGDKPLASADALLGTYSNWHDWMQWPQVPGASTNYQTMAVKQGDPEAKNGIVGAFNRTYDIPRAMDELLPGIYAQCDNDPNRFTYLGGSTTGGAVLYDNGKFLYSHHATDPCSGKLVNSFDLIRLHKFGDRDDTAADGTPVNRLPSYKAMCEFAIADKAVAALLAKERWEAAVADFSDLSCRTPSTDVPPSETDWMAELTYSRGGGLESTIHNTVLILNNDPLLKGKIGLNEFSARREVLGALPWNRNRKRRPWTDTDDFGAYDYLQVAYNITSRSNIDAAVDLVSFDHSFNEVQNYIGGLSWDGVPRLDTMLIDFLGAEDTEYNRTVCRKTFTAAVARAMEPGCKFDNMLILIGRQGLGKSTILDKMSLGWFNDSIRTFEGKETAELLPGVWLVEVAELDAFKKSDVSRIKQFLSLRADRYRAAYGRHKSEYPRRCIFIGTGNEALFLTDRTGNRRFWPVDVGVIPAKKNVWDDLTQPVIDQLWAEAKFRWQMGEALYLSGEMEAQAQEQQELHRDAGYREGMIADFVNQQIPSDWSKWPVDRRRDFWAGGVQGEIQLVDRERITAVEVLVELFNVGLSHIDPRDIKETNSILARLPGWRKAKQAFYCGATYKTQRGFERFR